MGQPINLQQALGGGRSLTLAPGVYDVVGQSLLDGCCIQAHGVTFNVTDKAQSPILMGSDVTLDGGRFFWPDQDGSTPYPALVTDPGKQSNNVTLRDLEIANACDDVPENTGAMIQGTDTSELIIQNCRFDAGLPQVGIGGNAVQSARRDAGLCRGIAGLSDRAAAVSRQQSRPARRLVDRARAARRLGRVLSFPGRQAA